MLFLSYFIAITDLFLVAFYSIPIDVPSGLAEFPELFISPKPWVLSTFTNNIQYSLMEKGGHFAALGQPKLFANDVVQFVKKVEEIAKRKIR